MELWESSRLRIYDPRIGMDMKRLVDKMLKDWPFPKWTFQVGRDGGYRTEEHQRKLLEADPPRTKTMQSAHREGKALDFTLYWKDTEQAIWDRMSYGVLFGFIWLCARELEIPLAWGGDWDGDWHIGERENWEVDFVHVERAAC